MCRGYARARKSVGLRGPNTSACASIPHSVTAFTVLLFRIMIVEALHQIVNHRESLSREDAHTVMGEVLSGKCTDAQIAALLVGLHMKGETVEEIVGFAEAIRAVAVPISAHGNSL